MVGTLVRNGSYVIFPQMHPTLPWSYQCHFQSFSSIWAHQEITLVPTQLLIPARLLMADLPVHQNRNCDPSF